MEKPFWALSLFFLIVIVSYYIFRPVNGWFWLIRDGLKNKKIVIEDILKELYHIEEKNITVNNNTLRNRLQIPKSIFLKALHSMLEHCLVEEQSNKLILTTQGREYALQIIRAHRLYEKYLAEKTGYAPSEWHLRAEQMEHQLEGKKLREIINEVGDPRYDPHGDPIPTSNGFVKKLNGIPLSEVENNTVGRIIHIEDKPTMVYKQILAENIHIGAIIRVVKKTKESVAFYSEGEDFILITEIAQNITILPIENSTADEEKDAIRLFALKTNEEAEVIAISRECRGANRQRLLDLGFVKGSKVRIDLVSPSGNPRAYLIRNTSIALRNDQAKYILIKKIS